MSPRLYWQIHKLGFLLEKKADENLKKQSGIGLAQYKVLEAIGRNSLARQNMIAGLLDQTEASISRQIKILQKRGLIVVGTVMGNKRARELTLTDKGEDLIRQCEQALEIAHGQLFNTLSNEEQQAFSALLDKMLRQVKQ